MGLNTDFVIYEQTLNVSRQQRHFMSVKFPYLEAFQQQSGPQFGK